jgi:hypothetical protein
VCARCGGPIGKEEPWELDHSDDRFSYLGPSHRTCNRSAGGRRGAAITNGNRAADPGWTGPGWQEGRRWSRDWDALGDDEGRRVPPGW